MTNHEKTQPEFGTRLILILSLIANAWLALELKDSSDPEIEITTNTTYSLTSPIGVSAGNNPHHIRLSEAHPCETLLGPNDSIAQEDEGIVKLNVATTVCLEGDN